ncbi:MAG TPA: hypothetical protein VGL86_14340 [Polyangia bacterium]
MVQSFARALVVAAIFAALVVASGCRNGGVGVPGDLGGSGSGVITLAQRATASGFITDASATLTRDNGPTPMVPCTTQTIAGGCTATTCTQIMDLGTPPIVLPASAGVITIAGGASPLSFTPSPDDSTYSPSGSPMNLWSGGETLVASAPGGEVPGFMVSLTAPAAVTITAPSGAVTLPSGQDLVLSTTATAMVRVSYEYIDATAMPTTTLDVACTVAPQSGSVVMPAAALALAPSGKRITVAASTSALGTVDVGSWSIAFSASSNAAFPGGANGVSVTVQ